MHDLIGTLNDIETQKSRPKFRTQEIEAIQMRVTIGQINTINGDFESNTASIIRAIEQGKKDKSDLVVLPETSIQGYTSLDWFLDRDVEQCALAPLSQIIEATEGITAIFGTVR